MYIFDLLKWTFLYMFRDNRYIIEQVEELHAIDSLSELLTRGAFDIRKGVIHIHTHYRHTKYI